MYCNAILAFCLRIGFGVLLPLASMAATAQSGHPAAPAPLAPPAPAPDQPMQRVVVTLEILRPAPVPPAEIEAAQSALLDDLAGFTYRVVRRYTSLPLIALELEPAALAFLRIHPRVASVSADTPVRGFGTLRR